MKKLKIRGKELAKIGYPDNKVIGVAINVMLKHYKRKDKGECLEVLKEVLNRPEKFRGHEFLYQIVEELVPGNINSNGEEMLVQIDRSFKTYGTSDINYRKEQKIWLG